ncbi:MAG: hypothetical protein HN904_13290 [Victivallales bacterium]|jgi:hypothetical protein|nr:hypothetical protein [Victivallales bacterium]MBT7163748.1 hypothetical protein [Victivallales bacterium]
MSENVSFGATKFMGFLGTVGGTAIAVGVPAIVLGNAAAAGLGGFAATLLSLAGIVGGVALAIVAVFFSIVTPSKVSEG